MSTNRGPATRRAHKRCAYLWCGKFFRPRQRYARARFCSRRCSAKSRSHAFYVALGKRGGRAKADKHQPLRRALVLEQLHAKTVVEAYDLGRLHRKVNDSNQLQSVRREGYSAGYQAGYEAAMKEVRRSA